MKTALSAMSGSTLESNRELRLTIRECLLERPTLRFVVRVLKRGLDACNLLQQLDLRRRTFRVLQNRKRHPQILGRTEVLLEIETLASVRQVIELAFRDGFPDSILHEARERHLMNYPTLAG